MAFPAGKQTAKLFMHGRSQAVRLPKEFRFEGTEVRVSKAGDKVILEPFEKRPFDVKAWRSRLDSYLDTPFPEVAEEAPVEADHNISFD
ncbi:MAG: AbrB/MazE/SpoVT family DNA-binding domain-containing protein [Beijerinckiaceae bacterium]